ncbi:hypothetical protein VHUM_04255 [Vanrija humicola]|uniref:NADP-dependent oxidoreductase domain-containing protein n=1 Tax=Vanrija humicola TaxID=5417 RepID=A0A7D8UX55_VANHU|nr:hypothetical protein VHUM_04255 [Vanrija humicola]
MTAFPTVTLNDGNKYPVLGFGTGSALYQKDASDLVVSALESGFVSLDTAEVYANTDSVGDALKRWGGKREDVYILTKWGKSQPGSDVNEPRKVLEGLLKELGTDYVDLYLIHFPKVTDRPLADTWKVFEQIKRDGLARSIGVSNFAAEKIEELAQTWEIPAAVNQIEYSPYIYHSKQIERLAAVQKKYDVKFQAYGPLSSLSRSPGGPLDPVVKKIAEKHNATEAQVLLKWAQQFGGGTVVTTSRNVPRQKEYVEAFTKLEPLTDAEVNEIAEAGKGRFFRQFLQNIWDEAEQ